jgi:hypothetical protein
MSKPSNVTTDQIDRLVAAVNAAYQRNVGWFPDCADAWRDWRDDLVHRLHAVVKPSARPYAGRVVAEVAIEVLGQDAEVEALVLKREIKRLKEALARRPQVVTATIPAQEVTIRSRIQQEALRLMGARGLGRSWRIIDHITAARIGKPNSVRNALRALTTRGLIDDYRRLGEPVGWSHSRGGARRLVVLTDLGRSWYENAYQEEPRESELVRVARHHRSVGHGVGILEALDHLQAAGYEVDADPDALLATGERWGRRAEPDLMVRMDGDWWPVEVQREVSERILGKWEKALKLAGRLALIVFSRHQERNQAELLRSSPPPGTVRLSSLEGMEDGDWIWGTIHSPMNE